MPRALSIATAPRYATRSSGTGRSRSSARTPSSAQVIATRSESPASWNSGAIGRSDANSMSRSRQDEHPPARHAAVHAPRHLQDLVGAEVDPGEHVAAALDDVGEARVVDHHGVEARAR